MAGAIAIGACDAGRPGADDTQVRRGLPAIAGIPQQGFTLGDPRAPWTWSVISAPTSFELDDMITQLPTLAQRFVRAGLLNVKVRTPTAGAYMVSTTMRRPSPARCRPTGPLLGALVRFVSRNAGGPDPGDLATLLRRSGVPDVRLAMAQRSSPRIRAARQRAAAAAGRGRGQVVYMLSCETGSQEDLILMTERLAEMAQRGRIADAIEERVGAPAAAPGSTVRSPGRAAGCAAPRLAPAVGRASGPGSCGELVSYRR